MTTNSRLPELTAGQRGRHAGPAISGYLYQFERSVVEILQLEPNGFARVEGIEDVDLWSADGPNAVQIKYHESTSWSLANIRKPILEMLRSFADGAHLNYVLYVHFGSGEQPPSELTLEQLKACLTSKPLNQEPIRYYEQFSEQQLQEFLQRLVIQHGVSLEEQKALTVSTLVTALSCSKHDAEILHRSRAIHFLEEVATRKAAAERLVSREDLLAFLNVKEILYSRWHQELVGRDRFRAEVIKRLKDENFGDPTRDRAIVIDGRQESSDDMLALALVLAEDFTGPRKRRTTGARPWTLIVRENDDFLLRLKRDLISKEVPINDGYESIAFSAQLFKEPPVVNGTGRVSLLSKASYSLRVASEDVLEQLSKAGHQFSLLLTIGYSEPWYADLAIREPLLLDGVETSELTRIIEKVTS